MYNQEQETMKAMQEGMKYLDNNSFKGQFLLTPDIKDDADFKHLTSDTLKTNLKQRLKDTTEVDEVGYARAVLGQKHVLNNPQYYKDVEIDVLSLDDDGNQKFQEIKVQITNNEGQQEVKAVQIPLYEKRVVQKPKFPLMSHSLNSEYYSLILTSASRNGWILEQINTMKLDKSETLTEKTDVKKSWNPFNKGDKQ